MAEVERDILNHYHLSTLYPSEWPTRDDESDAGSDNEGGPKGSPSGVSPGTVSKPRFAALDRQSSLRSSISGSQKIKEGVESVVQKDEPDPLGIAPSVVQQLRRQGLPVEDDLRLRNRFMLSSTTFSPTLFLSQVHQTASTESLLQGLDFLSRSIEQKSASLKVLVESNFERFVKAKATIDNVYTEMRAQGAEPQQQQQPAQSLRRPHSRHASKGNMHFRGTSGTFSPTGNKALPIEGRKKNALTKESEYGVQGIKAPLIEVAVKAEEVWGPALGGRDKEEGLKTALGFIEHNRTLFGLGASVQNAIRERDYDTLVEQYQRARRYADEARGLAAAATQNNGALSDDQIHKILVSARVWSDVDEQVNDFIRDAWRQLSGSHASQSAMSNNDDSRSLQMELIAVLLQLGVGENPIWKWLLGRFDYLRDKFTRTFERARIETEILRRRLAANERPSLQIFKTHLQSAHQGIGRDRNSPFDTPKILEFWEKVQGSLNGLFALQNGILGEIVEFWETAQSFISGKAQKQFPNAVFVSEVARYHLELSEDNVRGLRVNMVELVSLVRESIFAFFVDPPVEDISDLLSPVPLTPITPNSALTPKESSRKFSFDAKNLPPPSPKRGDPWEKYAFWAPYANSLSGALYLSRISILVGIGASELAALSIVREDHALLESLRGLVGGVRERCVQAVCAAWNSDAERSKVLEDWTRSAERRDLTNMPARFMAWEENILSNMQRILYVSEAMNRSGSADVVVPPSTKLLQMVRSQFVTSLYKVLSGAVENAEKSKRPDDEPGQDPDGLTVPARGGADSDPRTSMVDATNKVTLPRAEHLNAILTSRPQNIRLLLTLSNLSLLRRETIAQLISQFETSFSVSLTDETKTLRDVQNQIDARLFQAYVSPTVSSLFSTISSGIAAPSWVPATPRPTNAKAYVYSVLLSLVLVHTEVSTTATTLTNQILSYLLEQVSSALLSAFKQRTNYSLPALMQATLDVELIAQTLSNYTTEKASETQSQIYLVLDERTDHDARMRLQGELPEMRAILKRLREGTKGQFGCFKRERRGRSERERPQSKV